MIHAVAHVPDDPEAMEDALASGRPASLPGKKNRVAMKAFYDGMEHERQ